MNNQKDKKEKDTNNRSDSQRPIHSGIATFPERLKTLIADDSIRAFANKCGVHESTIRTYLHDGKTPRMEHLMSISTACGVTTDWLITGKGIKHRSVLKEAEKRLYGAPPSVSAKLPPELEPYRQRLDALLNYLVMIDDEQEREMILGDFILRAEKTIELSELKHTVEELRAAYKKNAG